MDDLDRIPPGDAVEVLEALKNIFDIPNCIFILAIDYDENAVELTKKNLKKFNLSNVSVIFGDGAGAVVLQPATNNGQGILSTHLHSDGAAAEILAMYNPGTHANHWGEYANFDEAEIGQMFMSHNMIDSAQNFPFMDGPSVFKKAIVKFPEVILEALQTNGYATSDLNMLIPHQANLRIAQFVQQKLGLRGDQVYNNIMQYGNTTAASVPIALCEAYEKNLIKEGDLVCLAAFGSGFTWASALIKW